MNDRLTDLETAMPKLASLAPVQQDPDNPEIHKDELPKAGTNQSQKTNLQRCILF